MHEFSVMNGRRVVSFPVMVQPADPKKKMLARYLGPDFTRVKKSSAVRFTFHRDMTPRERMQVDAGVARLCGGETKRLDIIRELTALRAYVRVQVHKHLGLSDDEEASEEKFGEALDELKLEEARLAVLLQSKLDELEVFAAWSVLWADGPEHMRGIVDLAVPGWMHGALEGAFMDAREASAKEDGPGK